MFQFLKMLVSDKQIQMCVFTLTVDVALHLILLDSISFFFFDKSSGKRLRHLLKILKEIHIIRSWDASKTASLNNTTSEVCTLRPIFPES